jgi:hypothetical protein
MTDAPHPHPADKPISDERPRRAMFVGVAIAVASILFVVTAATIYYRWATMPEPTCVLIVEAPATFRGVEVKVEGLDANYTAMIGAGERFALPFYLKYGTYSVRVTMGDQELLKANVELTKDEPGRRLDLSKLPPPTLLARPTTMPESSTPPSPFVTPSLENGPPPAPLVPQAPPPAGKL